MRTVLMIIALAFIPGLARATTPLGHVATAIREAHPNVEFNYKDINMKYRGGSHGLFVVENAQERSADGTITPVRVHGVFDSFHSSHTVVKALKVEHMTLPTAH